ncbi:hypothetical protein QE152_g39726 [Popillia japonica]|uniref:Uncharacterized protein n=1 Tax=Popillia japonica TaxID=7064 RepID=A0AAW1HTB1_POPJA
MDIDMKFSALSPKTFYGKQNTHTRDYPSDSEDSILEDDMDKPNALVGTNIQNEEQVSNSSDDEIPLVNLLRSVSLTSKAFEVKWKNSVTNTDTEGIHLIVYLKNKEIHSVGTIRANRLPGCTFLSNSVIADALCNSRKKMKKRGRSSSAQNLDSPKSRRCLETLSITEIRAEAGSLFQVKGILVPVFTAPLCAVRWVKFARLRRHRQQLGATGSQTINYEIFLYGLTLNNVTLKQARRAAPVLVWLV